MSYTTPSINSFEVIIQCDTCKKKRDDVWIKKYNNPRVGDRVQDCIYCQIGRFDILEIIVK